MQATDVRRAYSSGTPYTLLESGVDNVVDFGTSDPSLTLNAPGTWLIMSRAVLEGVGLTYATADAATVQISSDVDGVASIVDGTISSVTLPVCTTADLHLGNISLPNVLYTTQTAGDELYMEAYVDTDPGAGSVTISQAEIIAIRLY